MLNDLLANHLDLDELKKILMDRHYDRYGFQEKDMDILVRKIASSSFMDLIVPITDRWLETGEYETFED